MNYTRLAHMAVLTSMAGFMLGTTPAAYVTVDVEKLRSEKGVIQICLTSQEEHFPDCEKDPQARYATVPANMPTATFSGLPHGRFALAVMHDENANDRLDKFAGIPREGIGFSRNPKFTFGPPKFKKAVFETGHDGHYERIRIRYFL